MSGWRLTAGAVLDMQRRTLFVAPVLADLVQQPGPHRLRLRSSFRHGRNHFDVTVPAQGDRVLPRVDPHPQGTARQEIDAAPTPPSTAVAARRE
jgi:hypothetical protein